MNARYLIILGFFFTSLLIILGALSWVQPYAIQNGTLDGPTSSFLFKFSPLVVGILIGVVLLVLMIIIVESKD